MLSKGVLFVDSFVKNACFDLPIQWILEKVLNENKVYDDSSKPGQHGEVDLTYLAAYLTVKFPN